MRKTLKLFLASVMTATLFLAGCGSASKTGSGGTASAAATDIVGAWKLDTVLGTVKGGTSAEVLAPEENASKYGEASGIYTFKEDGNGSYTSEEGGGTFEYSGTWKSTDATTYVFSALDEDSTYTYDASTDTLHRMYEDATGEDPYEKLEFVFKRVK